MKTLDAKEAAAQLRQKAEAAWVEQTGSRAQEAETLSPEAVGLLLHELQVHQLELEMQNQELCSAQEGLEHSRARYFDLYEEAPVGYCTLSAEGVVLEANQAVISMLDTTRPELVNQALTRFICKEDKDIYYLHRKRFRNASGPRSCELRMVNRDGEDFWVQLSTTDGPADSMDAGVQGPGTPITRVVLSDISELKRMEAEKTTLATQLHQARKLETLGVLAVGISHDFDNLLTVIMSNASTGSQLAEGDEDLTRMFGAIETSALGATELVGQLLAYTGRLKWAMEEVDLDIVVKEISQTLAAALPRNVTLTCELADRVPFWKGDSTQIYRVLMNLVSNAFEAFPYAGAGEISIRTGTEEVVRSGSGPGTWVLPPDPGHYVVVEVKDSGSGMAPDLLYHAFEPFFTTKATGRGLGLAVVHGILDNHGGGLWVRSTPEQGTSFRVYLPAMTEPRSEAKGEVLSTWQGQGTVLVVDFDKSGRSLARNMAKRFGFTVLEARGGLEAISTFGQRRGELALVLLDKDLKGTSALETYRRIRELDSRVPIVLTPGHGVREGFPGKDRHPVSNLRKPYRLAEFQATLQRALEPAPPGLLP